MDNVLKMPAINECHVTGGFDEGKGKSYITLTYDGIAITEYYDEPGTRGYGAQVLMTHCARRARHRLGVALAVRQKPVLTVTQ